VAIRDGKPVRFTPKGLCDAFDSTDAFAGACALLTNLVFDQANPEVIVSRPGVGSPQTSFAGFTSPTFVSVQITIGTMVYGMVSSARNPGQDEPFAYNLLTSSFITISGVTAGNTPTSPATSGAWTPPTMAVVSTYILVTHPGFSGVGANIFGAINIANPAAPAWTSQDLATNPMGHVPTSVANFNNRAYFAYGATGNHLALSDVLAPLTRTNASQDLTIGDTTPITAQSGLPVQTISSGVIGALVVFKAFSIWQITGDPSINNLGENFITLTTGCAAPRSIALTPFGIVFVGVDAPYVLNFLGTLAPLSHTPGADGPPDVQVPFQNATTPSRIAASFSGNIYRVCLATSIQGVAQTNDYWYDIRRKRWNGPHSFSYDCASQFGNGFILSGAAHGAALFEGPSLNTPSSVYSDNGTAIQVHLRSSTFPKTQQMAEVQVVESTIEFAASGASVNYSITGLDDQGNTIDATFVATPAAGITWGGGAVWGGGAIWTSAQAIPHVYNIPWTVPLVFQKMALDVMAPASSGVSIGTFFARYQNTGYTNRQ
jgi:hypothetical protein